jgi:hypothetical protein
VNKIIFVSKYLILDKLRYTDCTTTFIMGAIPTCGNCNADDFSIVNPYPANVENRVIS